MKILSLFIIALCLSQICAYSIFYQNDPTEIAERIADNDWNVYVVYFYDGYNGLDDKVLRSHLNDDILPIYGDFVWYGEVDISFKRNQELLSLINFDMDREALIKGNARTKDVPFVLLLCHGLGWILQGDNAHHHINRYIDTLIAHAEKSETIAHEF